MTGRRAVRGVARPAGPRIDGRLRLFVALSIVTIAVGCAAPTAAPTGSRGTPEIVDLGIDPTSLRTDVGATWARSGWAPADQVHDIVATGMGFLALGESEGKDALWLSPDGREWERTEVTPDLGQGPFVVGSNADRVVVLTTQWLGDEDGGPEVGSTAEMVAWSSDDGGRTWTQADTTTDHALGLVRPRCGDGETAGVAGLVWTMVAAPMGFVASGLETVDRGFDLFGWLHGDDCDWQFRTVLWHSPDGRTWDRVATPASLPSWAETVLAADAERFVLLASTGDDPTSAWSSADGVTWEEAMVADPPWQVTEVVPLGTGFLALGYDSFGDQQDPRTWLSADGTSWSPGARLLSAMDSADLEAGSVSLVAGGDGVVGVGWSEHGKKRARILDLVAFSSVDGRTWTHPEPFVTIPPGTPESPVGISALYALAASRDHAVVAYDVDDEMSGTSEYVVWASPADG